mgnify:CR=1 FL=1
MLVAINAPRQPSHKCTSNMLQSLLQSVNSMVNLIHKTHQGSLQHPIHRQRPSRDSSSSSSSSFVLPQYVDPRNLSSHVVYHDNQCCTFPTAKDLMCCTPSQISTQKMKQETKRKYPTHQLVVSSKLRVRLLKFAHILDCPGS